MLAALFSLFALQTGDAPVITESTDAEDRAIYRVEAGGRESVWRFGPVEASGWLDIDGDDVEDFVVLEGHDGPGGALHASAYDMSTGQPYLIIICHGLIRSAETAFEDCRTEYLDYELPSALMGLDLINQVTQHDGEMSFEDRYLIIPNWSRGLNSVLVRQHVETARARLALARETGEDLAAAEHAYQDALARREDRAQFYSIVD